MTALACKVIDEFKSLPPSDQEEVSRQIACIIERNGTTIADDDPIRSARGMFAGSRLSEALIESRTEERRRG